MNYLNNFIKKANRIYNNKYDYSKVEYINARTKVIIVCPLHGDFLVTPNSHISKKQGCPICNKRIFTKKDFIDKAREIHGDKYDYSKVKYEKSNKKVCIICPIHGEFWQIPISHYRGHGCKKCVDEAQTSSNEEFIKKANKIHGDRYDYSKCNYKNGKSSIEIVCKKHGSFFQRASHHLEGRGCPKCGRTKTTEKFIEEAINIHGNIYDYSKVKYIGDKCNVKIICKKHGVFSQLPFNHLAGKGCNKCAIERRVLTTDDFVKKAKLIHGNKYDYSKVKYEKSNKKVCIICPIHGEFLQSPDNHIYGKNGCEKCSHISPSKPENEILKYIKTFYDGEILQNNRDHLNGKEIDIYIPNKKTAIEYNGMFWHSEKYKDKYYHIDKKKLCKKKNIDLIQITDFDWNNKKDIVKSIIRNKLKQNNHRIYARKCDLKEVDSKDAKNFLIENHIQGAINSKINLGLYFNKELVYLMTFGKSRYDKKSEFELYRMCTRKFTLVIGGATKIFKHFLREYNPKSVISYCLLDYGTGRVYEKMNFIFSHLTSPNYFYIKGNSVLSRIQCQKHKLIKKYGSDFCKNKTEKIIMNSLGYYRYYDSGNSVWKWRKQ